MATDLSVGPLHARWHVVSLGTPRALRRCARCDRPTPFASSDRFRVNAQQHRLDVWLIYRCTVCHETWNRPILMRAAVAAIDPHLLARFHGNDGATARAIAADGAALRACSVAVDDDVAVRVEVEMVRSALAEPWRVELDVPVPCGLRLDRLVAQTLGVSRSALLAWRARGVVGVEGAGPDPWRRPIRHGTRLVLHLSRA